MVAVCRQGREMSVRVASVQRVIQRWSRDQVLALAPDAPSKKAAQGVATPGKWSLRGTTGDVVFGECKGSGAKPYLAAVDLTEPAYRCSCPSRKFPCKHALGLLLLWSADEVPEAEAVPPWTAEWLASALTAPPSRRPAWTPPSRSRPDGGRASRGRANGSRPFRGCREPGRCSRAGWFPTERCN